MSDVRAYQDEATAARTRIADAIEELSDRLSPQTIIREVKGEARQAVREVRDQGMQALFGVRDQAADTVDDVENLIRGNPVAIGLGSIILGVAVTAAVKSGQPRRSPDYDDEYARYARGDDYAADALRKARVSTRDRLRNRWRDARETIGDVAHDVSDVARSAFEATAERLTHVSDAVSDETSAAGDRLASGLDRIRDGATDAAERAARAARDTGARTADVVENNPEVSIMLAIVAGALLALSATGDGHVANWRDYAN